ncbi:hypothetical protein QYM36_012453 [Artemia franciscana]|uniref:Uncharacterized protein n=1 Tax=Artemia franciscana TaxID=6661 RepID=A0AA88L303_ARTSF|nr:hypothetical protein QYM36_012453 [Artemia franciscana]
MVETGNEVAESLPALQLLNLHALEYASNAKNTNKLISFAGLLLNIERLQPTASNRPTANLTIASDNLATPAEMKVWKKPDNKSDVSILQRYAIVNPKINIFRNSTNLVPSLIVPTRLINLGHHHTLPRRQSVRLQNPTIVRDKKESSSMFADIQLLAKAELAMLREVSYTAVISRLVTYGIDIDIILEDLEAVLRNDGDVKSDTKNKNKGATVYYRKNESMHVLQFD